jgi:hypothetical protein
LNKANSSIHGLKTPTCNQSYLISHSVREKKKEHTPWRSNTLPLPIWMSWMLLFVFRPLLWSTNAPIIIVNADLPVTTQKSIALVRCWRRTFKGEGWERKRDRDVEGLLTIQEIVDGGGCYVPTMNALGSNSGRHFEARWRRCSRARWWASAALEEEPPSDMACGPRWGKEHVGREENKRMKGFENDI